jgi:hypothetical protein
VAPYSGVFCYPLVVSYIQIAASLIRDRQKMVRNSVSSYLARVSIWKPVGYLGKTYVVCETL